MAVNERRKFIRIPFWFVARYKSVKSKAKQAGADAQAAPGRAKEFKDAYGKNISTGGILIETEEYFPVSTVLEIELDIPSLPESIVVRGRVVRSYEIEKDKLYDNGVQFEAVDEKYKKTIGSFIELFK
jgi:Tfp pilus assembly protein PilZ